MNASKEAARRTDEHAATLIAPGGVRIFISETVSAATEKGDVSIMWCCESHASGSGSIRRPKWPGSRGGMSTVAIPSVAR